MIKQKAVKTFIASANYPGNIGLNEYLEDGWKVVMCNTICGRDGETQLEYIIQKGKDAETTD